MPKPILIPIATGELCSYGCGQVAKYINGAKKRMCDDSSNKCPAHRTREVTVDFCKNPKRLGRPERYRDLLVIERGHKCESCNNTTWNNHPIPLLLLFKDGSKTNTDRDNLLLTCHNCSAILSKNIL